MNAEKATSLIPLYGGVALLVLAATGAALSLTDSEGRATGGGARQGGCTYVEACCASSRRNKKTTEGRGVPGARTGQHQDLPPQGISLKSVTTLRQLAAERGRIPERARRMWCGSTKRLSSVDHFLRIKAVHRLAREDLDK